MKSHTSIAALTAALYVATTSFVAAIGPVFYGDPPDDHHPWAVHDANRPEAPVITPGTFSTQEQPGKPPSDAIILFDGTDLSKWEANNDNHEPTKWIVKDGAMECVPGAGYIRTKEQFGDCQLHVEWTAPTDVKGDSQGRGNSGVFLMGIMEIQVLDNYNNPTYADGAAGSLYCVNPPMVNALRPPGQFQTYDIIFRRPVYKNGKLLEDGYVTVIENGVIVQDHTKIIGQNNHTQRNKYTVFPDVGPLKFQDHGNPVRFRNVWYRNLPKRPIEGGTDGDLTTEATMAKRKEIAASIRKDAETLTNPADPLPQMYRFAESIVYEKNEAVFQKVEQLATQYTAAIKQLPLDKLTAKKDEIRHARDVFGYLARWKFIPVNFAPKADVEQIIKDQKWDDVKK